MMKQWVVAVAVLLTGCGSGVAELITPEGSLEASANQNRDPTGQTDDAGTPVSDAGTPVSDAGTSVIDAGTPLIDAGTPVIDAGTPPVVDAGTPPVIDAGTPVIDAGAPPVIDAGAPPVIDAGAPPVIDAGTPRDAGVITPGDAGTADVQFVITSTSAHPISPYIYGKNFNGTTWAQEPHLTLNRLGGNRWSAYNWENNASNAGIDWNSQSDDFLGGGNTPGEAVRAHVANARAAGGATLVTLPMLGWVAADKLGTSVLNQPITSRFFPTVAAKGSAFQYPPNLTDGTVAQDEFVSFLEGAFPNAHADPAREVFYSLDNEPDLWSGTHVAIHPSPVTYTELLTKSVATSAALKAVAPSARVFGFVSYGFAGFVNLQSAPDGAGRDFTEFFLDGMRTASASRGTRLLDVLDLHWYPEATGGGVRITGEETSAAVVAARVQAPRSLWDPTYTETSWITQYTGGPLALISSMKAKIAAHYPGTGLAFTEYCYGGSGHISGAVAQADVLGIFGREGIFAAALWPLATNNNYLSAAFAMFRSYDGVGGSFGDTSVQATNSDTVNTSVYASIDSASPNRMVLVLINKATTAKSAALTVSHAVAFTRAEVYQLTSASPTPLRGTDVVLGQANALRYTMPAMSVTTLVLRP